MNALTEGTTAFWDSVEIGLWEWDLQTGRLEFSSKCEEILGYSAGRLPRRHGLREEKQHPDDRAVAKHNMEMLLSGRVKKIEHEIRYRHNDGGYIWVQERFAVSQWDEKGAPLRIGGMMQNVSGMKQAEEKAEAERRNREYVAHLAGLGSWEWSLNRDYVVFSDDYRDMLDRTPEEMNGPFEHLNEFVDAEDVKRLAVAYAEFIEKNDDSVFSMVIRGMNKRGGDIWLLNIASIVERDENGKPQLLRGGVLNIDKTVRVERQLREALDEIEKINRQLESDVVSAKLTTAAMFEANPQINILVNDQLQAIDCNPAAVDFFGYADKATFLLNFRKAASQNAPQGRLANFYREYLLPEFEKTVEKGYSEFSAEVSKGLLMHVVMKKIAYNQSYAIVTYLRERSEAEGRIQLMLDATPLACLLINENHEVVDCNQKALELVGAKSKKEYIRTHHSLHPEFQPDGAESHTKMHQYIEEAFQTGKVFFDWTSRTGGGEPIPMKITMVRVRWRDAHCLVSFSQDLRGILAEQEKTREAEMQTQLMLDSTPLICSVWDKNGNLIDCNMEVVRLFGVKDKEEYMERYYELNPTFQPDGQPSKNKTARQIEKALETGFARFSWEYRTLTGQPLPTEVTLIRVAWKNEYRILSYAHDLREIKKAATEVERHASLLQIVNEMAGKLIAAQPEDFTQTVEAQLKVIGEVVGADHIYVWENYKQNDEHLCRQTYNWSKRPRPAKERRTPRVLHYARMPYIMQKLFSGETVNKLARDLPVQEQQMLAAHAIKSILLIPIVVRGAVWGVIGFDNCVSETLASGIDEQVLQSCGRLMASAVARARATENLIDTKNDLVVHGKLLRAVNEAARLLLANSDPDATNVMRGCLQMLGESVDASRVSIWRNFEREDGILRSGRLFNWDRNPVQLQDDLVEIDYPTYLPEWDKGASGRKDINLPVRYTNEAMQVFARALQSKSLLFIHITIDGEFWGFISYSHADEMHKFSQTEIGILRSGGMLIASAIMRNETSQKLIEATETALASVRAKNEFLARMSHEIRTPMNAVIGMASVAQKSSDMCKIQECLDVVSASAQGLLKMINDILDMSNIDLGKVKIINAEFDLQKALEGAVRTLQPRISAKRQAFSLDTGRAFGRRLVSDEQRLRQVLVTLLTNAIKFTPEGGKISLKVRDAETGPDTSDLTIEVADDGIGIERNYLPRIFELFEQADGGLTRQYGGIGLGLPILKNIVTAMGGEVLVQSEPGEGSRFTVTLPVRWGREVSGVAANAALPPGLRVLVVDDREDVRDCFESILQGYSVQCKAVSGIDEALAALAEAKREGAPYGVVFLDWYLEGVNGAALVQKIERTGVEKSQIVLMSVADWSLIAEEAGQAGLVHFLPKPVLPSDIHEKLLELAAGNAAVGEPGAPEWPGKRVLLVEDLEINQLIAMELMADTGVLVDCANNGRQAVDMYLQDPQKYDIILMDMQMPVLDGISAAKEIRASGAPTAATVPIYAMTANAYKEDEAACLGAGMNGHIPKPVDVDVLYAAMESAFSR